VGQFPLLDPLLDQLLDLPSPGSKLTLGSAPVGWALGQSPESSER